MQHLKKDHSSRSRQEKFKRAEELMTRLEQKYGHLPPLTSVELSQIEDTLHTELRNMTRSRGKQHL